MYDGAGRPVPHAVIETWQPDPEGIKNGHFARVGTGSSGHYRLRTARPGRTPGSSSALHIGLSLFASGLNVVSSPGSTSPTTRTTTSPMVLTALPADRRHTLLAQPEPGPIIRYWFDITLQGNDETVFFLV